MPRALGAQPRAGRRVETSAHAVARAEELRNLVSELKRLPDRQRTALVLHEMGGVSHEAIGRRLNVSVGGSKALVSRARSGLDRACVAA